MGATSSATSAVNSQHGNNVSGNGSSGGASNWLFIAIAAAVVLVVFLMHRKK